MQTVKLRDKRVTEIDYQLKYAIFFTVCFIVYTTNQQTPKYRVSFFGLSGENTNLNVQFIA